MNVFDTAHIARILTFRSSDTRSPSPAPDKKKKRALVVEGDGFLRMRLIQYLVAAGLDVDSAPNGRLGLAKLRVCKPDTLILELNLGGIPGLQLIQRARQEVGFGSRPIYVFTFADFIKRSTRKKLMAAGAKIFDKSAIAEENVVIDIATELLGGTAGAEQLTAKILAAAGAAAPGGGVLKRFSETMGAVCAQAKHLANCIDVKERIESCARLREQVYSVLSCAAVGGLRNATHQAKALVGFLDHLVERPEQLNDSASKTIACGVEALSSLARRAAGGPDDFAGVSAVVADDADASGYAISETLELAGASPAPFEAPVPAPDQADDIVAEAADLFVSDLSPAAQPELNSSSTPALQSDGDTPPSLRAPLRLPRKIPIVLYLPLKWFPPSNQSLLWNSR